MVVKYNYDAYGNLISRSGNNPTLYNPFRYKGYYYDEETNLFYCNARYYNPEWGRWLTPDDVGYLDHQSINGLNLYAYCGNDPVNNYDPTGHAFIAVLVGLGIAALFGAGIGFGGTAYIDYQDDGQIFNGSVKWYDYLGATAFVAIIGAVIGYLAPKIVGALRSFSNSSFSLGGAVEMTSKGELVVSGGVTISGAQVLQGAGALSLAGTLMFMSKYRPGMTNRPPFSWVTQEEGIEAMNTFNDNANKAADYIMNNHRDKWKYGAGTDRNVIKKWLERIIKKLPRK